MGAADRTVAMMGHLATIGRVIVVLCCTAGLLLTFAGQEAHACDCAFPRAEIGTQGADAVFVAEATEVRDRQQGRPGATMEVSEVHAGEVHEELFVDTTEDTCAYEFQAGRQELIYATEAGGGFSANMCSVIPLDEAGEHLAALGEGSTPLPGAQEPDRTVRNVALGSLGLIILIILVTVARRAARRRAG